MRRCLGPAHWLSFTLSHVAVVVCAQVCAGQTRPAQDHAWRIGDPLVTAVNRGVALMERYDYTAAVEAFQEAAKLAPELAEVRVNLALALFNRAAKGDVNAAADLLDRALAESPDNIRALYIRGTIHHHAGEDQKALACFQRVVQRDPHQSHAWYLLALCKEHLGQPCRPELERAIQENPALVSAYYQLMAVARREGKPDQADRYQEQFVRLRKNPLAETVAVPQYQEMGPLAIVQPMSAPKRAVTPGELAAGASRVLFTAPASRPFAPFSSQDLRGPAGSILAQLGAGLARADLNGDGLVDLVTVAPVVDNQRAIAVLLAKKDGTLADATANSGLADLRDAISCAFGDYDNDGKVDLFVCRAGPNRLFKGRGDGTFEDVTAATGTAGGDAISVSAVFLDADHDADLDIYVCNATTTDGASPAPNQLLNNNTDGTFTDIAASGGTACAGQRSVMVAPVDLDDDRDTDLIVFHDAAPATVLFNDRLGKYHEQPITAEPVVAHRGGVAQDFNGDAHPDVLVFPAPDHPARLLLSDGTGELAPAAPFDGVIKSLSTWTDCPRMRVVDVDLDGDLDIVAIGKAGHVLLNDGWGRFVLKAELWPAPTDAELIGAELAELTADGTPDLLMISAKEHGQLVLVPTMLTPPANWLAITPTGDRGADQRTLSPASAFGTRMELRCGLHGQTIFYTGLDGGPCQSYVPFIFGLDGATQADYLFLRWPDGVTQSEITLTANTHHPVREFQWKKSSCPVLFAWNGTRFGFVTDFAGVGGLGYFVAPGQYAPPQVLEHVKIEPDQLIAKDGQYELRICEPMEEVGYLDRLELLAVDHPTGTTVYPDERLALTGPPPTHRLLCPAKPIFPTRAFGPDGQDCTTRLSKIDRIYAYQPPLDRRFTGFCQQHALVLDFEDQLRACPQTGVGPASTGVGPASTGVGPASTGVGPASSRSICGASGQALSDLPPDANVYLFINGWIEYPYSQTTYAAQQAGVQWQPLKIEQQLDDGRWETIVPDAGAPGGMGRMFTIDLTDKLRPADKQDNRCHYRLRITTNLEVYYDQLFIAADCGPQGFTVRTVPLKRAVLRRLGFPLEYSPDGRHPWLYNYDIIQTTSSFKLPHGAYTRYGPVEPLLREFDDQYVIFGTGDEIALSFDAGALPPPADGQRRGFILVSHAYCKDMDLYTAECDTVGPLPFRDMSKYPYPHGEHTPDQASFIKYRREFTTRMVE